MRNSYVNKLREGIEEWASEQEPQGGLTSSAYVLSTVLAGILSIPTMILQIFTTLVLGLLDMITFGLALVPFIGVLWLLNILTVGTSWLWLNIPISRPFILIPGSIFAAVQASYTALLPYAGDWDSRAEDLATAQAWPRSIHVQQLPTHRHEAMVEWELLKERYSQGGMTDRELMIASSPLIYFLERTTPLFAERIKDEYGDMTLNQ